MVRLALTTFLFSMIALSVFSCKNGETYNQELSNDILYDTELPPIDSIEKLQLFKVPQKKRWPDASDLKRLQPIFESLDSVEIREWIIHLRKHSDSHSINKPMAIFVIFVTMADGGKALIQVHIHQEVTYIIPYPAKNEFGVHGYASESFYELLESKGLIKN